MFLFRVRFSPVFLFFLISGFYNEVYSQCISTFPYREDFETSNGNWIPGGNASDWAWGSPSKNVISTAGQGNKCWITGTLTGNSYNDNESSWLQSPCFDFTTVTNPYISFLVFWDTEYGYDGAALQYSDDDGVSWQSLGNYGDASTGCENNNWYNYSSIRYAVQQQGWSGSYNNNGSGGWVTAYHEIPQLAGKSKVLFRFTFGAGKIQNNYNGFGVDNIYVGTVPNDDSISFSYTCNSERNVTFFPISSGCVTPGQWNFSDESSGVQNTASGAMAATHTFTSSGIYEVSLSGRTRNNIAVTSTQTVIIPDLTASVKTPILCTGTSGQIIANVANASTGVTYSWNADPQINTQLAQVKAGYYTVTVAVNNGCSASASVVITEPPVLAHKIETTEPDCNDSGGSVALTESGGVSPYIYHWSPVFSSVSSITNLHSGNYTATVTDKNLCMDNIIVALQKIPSPVYHTAVTQMPDCGVNNGNIKIIAGGGIPDYIYQWSPVVSHTSEADSIKAGNYTVIISDGNGCKDTAEIVLNSKPLTVFLGDDTVLCKGQTLFLKLNEKYSSYLWNDGSTTPVKEINKEGNYTLQVTNAGGCTASDTIHISVGCGDLLFPSGFTPNNDFINDLFGPTGGLSLVKSYRLLIYNRFGNLIYQSVNPYEKWSGNSGGKPSDTGTYIYIAAYDYNNQHKIKKGTLTLLR